LTGESAATAYLAAQLLAALGRSPAVVGVAGLRQRVAGLLSEALRHPNARREVYLLGRPKRGEERIEARGTLARALLDALGQVVELPE
ncbi:MAG TPA: hypothetical protein DEP84_20020, partial [Chloroflexi bacterium]|nr:hypothetical protein [Chloroflexota bacterium]